MLEQGKLYIVNNSVYKADYSRDYNCWLLRKTMYDAENWIDGLAVEERGALRRVRESFARDGGRALYYENQLIESTLDDLIEFPEEGGIEAARTIPGYSAYLFSRGLLTQEQHEELAAEARGHQLLQEAGI